MKKLVWLSVLASFLIMSVSSFAGPTSYGGVIFPDGDISFADEVYSYSMGGNVISPYNNPATALGSPDHYDGDGCVSLGSNGSLILKFTDNSLTASGDSTADLYIFEIGGIVEWMNISISTDASSWINLGDLKGQPTSIDIDAISGVTPGTRYSYVRINDILPNQSNLPWGEADIDAVGAISSAPPAAAAVPAPGALLLAGLGTSVVGWCKRKRTI